MSCHDGRNGEFGTLLSPSGVGARVSVMVTGASAQWVSDMVMIDRSAVARALAKAIAFKACGKDDLANAWAARLVGLLECHDILRDDEGGAGGDAFGIAVADADPVERAAILKDGAA